MRTRTPATGFARDLLGAVLALTLTLTLTLTSTPVHAAAAAAGPIAVMPFKNVNRAEDLAWLEVGVAETMVSDLRRAGQKVVERDQLELALTEIALQRSSARTGSVDASTAAKLGKMVGAKTVVVGGFQRANKKLRITARFVDVQTGEVIDTAKVTGTLRDIFSLQDEIVARLIGKKPPRRRAKARSKRGLSSRKGATRARNLSARKLSSTASSTRKNGSLEASKVDVSKAVSSDKTLLAYQAYAKSLSTTSPSKRVRLLREAIALDPHFIYALDDLSALEQRLSSLRKVDATLRSARAKKLMEGAFDQNLTPERRRQFGIQALGAHLTGFHYRALLEDAERLRTQTWPADDGFNLEEYASYSIFVAHNGLKEKDLALQAGERHLKEFAGGMYTTGVDTLMQSIINERRRDDDRRRELPALLDKIEESRRSDIARAKRYARNDDERLRERLQTIGVNRDFARCSRASSARVLDAVVTECGAFREQWGDLADEQRVLRAQWMIAQAFARAGKFGKAREIGETLQQAQPKWAAKMSVGVVVRTWPK